MYTGERYSQERLKNFKPPSFLTNQKVKVQPKVLMSIEISLNKHKNVIIKLKEGDDIHLVASNFRKAYSLDKTMEESLVGQLQNHL